MDIKRAGDVVGEFEGRMRQGGQMLSMAAVLTKSSPG